MARKAQRPTPNTKRPRPVDMAVGQKIRMYRIQAGMSQTSLGNGLGVTFQQVQKYEKGTNRVAPSRLSDIAQMLGIHISELFPSGGSSAQTLNPAELSIMTTARGQRLAVAWEQLSTEMREHIVIVVEAIAGAQEEPAS